MKLVLDTEKYDEYQSIFINDLIERIVVKLREAGMKALELEEATANIAFSIASAIDDTAGIESNGIAVNPYLAFRASDDEIIHYGENSATYEFVRPALKRLFDN
jgi:hypothetical protein